MVSVPVAVHRVARIDRQVDDRILQLVRVDEHRPRASSAKIGDLDPLAQRPVQQLAHAADQDGAVDPLGHQRLGAGEGQQAAGQRGGAGRAFHGVGEVGHDLAPRAVEPAPGEVDAADHHRQHIVEVVGDAAGQLADGLHLLDLAKLGLGRLALDRLGLQRLVGLPQLLGPLAHRLLELLGALGLVFGFPASADVLAQRLDRDIAHEDREQADDHAQPAQIIGQPVGFGREELGFLDLLGQRGALGVGDLGQLAAQLRADVIRPASLASARWNNSS